MKGQKICAIGMGKSSRHGAMRATPSRVREAVFNIIGPKIHGSTFLDLYAGTGAIGMEAMSRGATQVTYVEADPRRYKNLVNMLEGCGCSVKADMINAKAMDYVNEVAGTGKSFDVIYMDPPYDSDELAQAIPLIGRSGILDSDGILLAEHRKKLELPAETDGLHKKKTYKYGDTELSLYRPV